MRPGETTVGAGTAAAEQLLSRLAHRDVRGATDLALGLLEDGSSFEEVVAILAAAQEIVGERWRRNEWTVAQEHAATSAADRVLAAIASTSSERSRYPTVAVVSAEGEWHSLAPRMVTDVLRSYGWDATFLGGSIPSDHLREHYARTDRSPSRSAAAWPCTCLGRSTRPRPRTTLASRSSPGVAALARTHGGRTRSRRMRGVTWLRGLLDARSAAPGTLDAVIAAFDHTLRSCGEEVARQLLGHQRPASRRPARTS